MPATSNHMYFVAIVPPEPILADLQQMKLYFRDRYASSKSLNSPPHITLLAPFVVPEALQPELNYTLSEAGRTTEPFQIRLRHFGSFSDKVIFVDVVKNEALSALREKLVTVMKSNPAFNYNYDKREFRPHVTLAFRDLSRQDFQDAWKEFKHTRYEAAFEAKTLSLLKHDGKAWNIENKYKLKSDTQP